MAATPTAKFNVGGQIFEISRSLLDAHPNTLLTRSASRIWQEDPTSEIFMERDGELFRYVLHYLRDGSVVLPVTVSKELVLHELEYYCVKVENADDTVSMTECINPVQTVNVGLTGMKRTRDELDAEENEHQSQVVHHRNEIIYLSFAKLCIDKWMADAESKDTFTFKATRQEIMSPSKLMESYYDTIIACNKHLNKVCLEVSEIRKAHGKECLQIQIQTMRKIQQFLVSGAGTEAVNGVYIASGTSIGGVGMFTKKGLWQGEERVFQLSCPDPDTRTLKWSLSVRRDGHNVIDFYEASSPVDKQSPINLTWSLDTSSGRGVHPPPTVTPN